MSLKSLFIRNFASKIFCVSLFKKDILNFLFTRKVFLVIIQNIFKAVCSFLSEHVHAHVKKLRKAVQFDKNIPLRLW